MGFFDGPRGTVVLSEKSVFRPQHSPDPLKISSVWSPTLRRGIRGRSVQMDDFPTIRESPPDKRPSVYTRAVLQMKTHNRYILRHPVDAHLLRLNVQIRWTRFR